MAIMCLTLCYQDEMQVCCCCYVASVVSNSVQPHRWQPTRLLCPWDSPGKKTGVGCHFLLQNGSIISINVLVAQWCLTLCNPMDCIAHQAPLFMEFLRQEYWCGQSFLSSGYLSTQGLNSGFLHCRHLSHQGSPCYPL